MINLDQEFEVVVVETTGDVSVTTYFKNYTDYAKDKGMIEGEKSDDSLSYRIKPSDVGRFPMDDLAELLRSPSNDK